MRAEALTFPIVAVLLILIFGSLIAALLPLAVGALALLSAFLILRLVAIVTDISIFAVNIVTVLSLGLAIDYSLFIVSRFREELAHTPGDVSASLARTLETAGRTVLFSGLTVVGSLLSLLVFPQMFFQSMGVGGAAAALVAMIAALTVLPALLAVLGPRVNTLAPLALLRRGRAAPRRDAAGERGVWYQISLLVLRHPVAVLLSTLLLLLTLGLPFLHIRLAYPDARTLPPTRESRVASEILLRDFPRNETRPIQVIVYTPDPVLAPRSLGLLYGYTRQLQALPGVRRVDSLVTLLPELELGQYQLFYTQNPLGVAVAAPFARGQIALLTVLYDSDPYAPASQDLVQRIRALPPPPSTRVLVDGDPAVQVDFLASLARWGPVALALIVGVIFFLLFLLLGSLIVPLKAVVTNVLSLSVSFGALVWIFQDGHLAALLGVTPLGTIDGQMPVLIFAVAFGLSMDYEGFLLSRIREHYVQTGDAIAAVAIGVQKTGAIITGAALVLVVVFGSFLTGGVLFIKQLAVGLSVAILVDATIVRLLLVPALLRLLGHYNWWLPLRRRRPLPDENDRARSSLW